MEKMIHVYEEFRGKLGRNLDEEEKQFLKWVYERYLEEITNKTGDKRGSYYHILN